ncbi:MAG: hypothetical protein E7176_05085 [Erysipelotrichaceae bacterium]|nr:hypothetical protein [Erysipelotrichaceae bacterium]
MAYFGFILSTIIYLTVIVTLIYYIVNVIMKKYHFANNLLPFLFLYFFFSIMILSWGLILMNGGFDIFFSIKVDYTFIFVLSIILLFGIPVLDYFVKRNAYVAKNVISAMYRSSLPMLTVILFLGSTLIYYFICHYFAFLIA